MSWKRRLIELTLAGGLCSTSGCGPFFGCNANPDPCCRDPNGEACYQYHHGDMSTPEPPPDLSLEHD